MKGKETKYYRLGFHVDSQGGSLAVHYFVKGEVEGLTDNPELASLLTESELPAAEERIKEHYPEATPYVVPNRPVGKVWEFPID